MAKKNVPIKYTSRDFETIKQDLVDYARRYYPETFRDFNEASFGSLMLDTVAYIGDILSFYLDYQVNESFLNSAVEYDNVIRLAKQLGYNFQPNPTSYGIASLFVLVPAQTTGGGPDTRYMPILKKGGTFSTDSGATFMLTEDVNFSDSAHEQVVARVNSSTGVPTYFAVKAKAPVMSGDQTEASFTIGAHTRFLTVEVPGSNIAEIISVYDSEGHEYFEVDFLSQNLIYRELTNRSDNTETVKSILKPVSVPRRFIASNTSEGMTLQFGFGSDDKIKDNLVVDPAKVALVQHGRAHITDKNFDPSVLNQTDKFGVVPSNTTLFITYRENNASNVNIASNSLSTVVNTTLLFNNETSLDTSTVAEVRDSLEVNNEAPIIGDITLPNSEEIKKRALDNFATQNRIVTKQDYVSYIYTMPEKFGAIKRANIVQDSDSFKRNLNLYVVSENSDRKLVETNSLIKQNLKVWLNKNKIIHDTIDILNGRIVNLGINYTVIAGEQTNKFDVLTRATNELADLFEILPDMGESFRLSDVYSTLNRVRGVVDVVDVEVVLKSGTAYSDVYYNVPKNLSSDGRLVEFPEDFVWEIKYPLSDIKGTIQ